MVIGNNMNDIVYRKNCLQVDNKGWSNVSGYGNIIISNTSNNHPVEHTVKPWNRIQPLKMPAVSPANVKYAWSPPISKSLYNDVYSNCDSNPPQCNNSYKKENVLKKCCPFSNYKNRRVACFQPKHEYTCDK